MEVFEGLELALLFCIGLLGFIVFVMIGCFAKRGNSVYFSICGLFALFAFCTLTYDSFFTQWAYAEGNVVWNLIATVLVTIGYCAVFMGILYVWMLISEHEKYSRKAANAGMDISTFKAWKESTIKTLADKLREEKGECRYHDLLSLYEKEEWKLFAASA